MSDKKEPTRQFMVNPARPNDPHIECPDCRGVCTPVVEESKAASPKLSLASHCKCWTCQAEAEELYELRALSVAAEGLAEALRQALLEINNVYVETEEQMRNALALYEAAKGGR